MRDVIVDKLNIVYGDKIVLKDFSAAFKHGRCTAVMGKSGCGKTSLLNAMLGLLKTVSGTVEGMPDKVGVVFQEDRLCEEFTGLANIKLGGDGMVQDLGVRLDKPVKELSGGQRRRIAIARAMASNAELIIMDEPFKGLDGASKEMVMNVLRNMDRTIIFVTHDTTEAETMDAIIIEM